MSFDPLRVDVPRLLAALGIQAQHEGDRWVGKCPSPGHVDKNPSWDIVDIAGTSKHGCHSCFSCHFEGTATELVRDLLNISFQGARDWISERAMGQAAIIQSVAVQTILGSRRFKLPPEVVIASLDEWPEIPRRYITGKKRRITAEQVARWRLGYAVSGRLAGRIIIPARDSNGLLLSYTARTFAGSPKRYLEPKKFEGAHDGAIFGEEHWPPPNERDIVVVTEGAFNYLAVERVAPSLPGASLYGSQVQITHLRKLSTFKRGLILTDPDLAGERAAEKLWILNRHMQLSRVVLEPAEDGEKVDANSIDPDELRKALIAAYKKLK